jgi:hypothetical protein
MLGKCPIPIQGNSQTVGFGIPGILKIRLKKSKKSKRIKGKKEGRRGTNIRGLANICNY